MTRLTFTEYDAYAEAVRDVSMTMRMYSRQVSNWTVQYASVGSLGVQQGFEGGGSIAEGATGSDGWTLYHQSHPGYANGQVTNGDEVFAVPPGGEFCLACKPSHEWISVHIPKRTAACDCSHAAADRGAAYCRAMAMRRRSSGEMKWSLSSTPTSSWTQWILPVNLLAWTL